MSQNSAAASQIRTVIGTLVVSGNTIAIKGEPPLALCNEDDQLAAAVRAFGDLQGEEATVTGSDGFIGKLKVFCVRSLTSGNVSTAASVIAAKPAARKGTSKKSRKPAAGKRS
jgi:hypothetical protein